MSGAELDGSGLVGELTVACGAIGDTSGQRLVVATGGRRLVMESSGGQRAALRWFPPWIADVQALRHPLPGKMSALPPTAAVMRSQSANGTAEIAAGLRAWSKEVPKCC